MIDTALVIEVRRLAALVADLAEDQQHTERRRLALDDRRVGTVLLPLAADLIGAARFTGPALTGQALNDRTPTGQALREVLPLLPPMPGRVVKAPPIPDNDPHAELWDALQAAQVPTSCPAPENAAAAVLMRPTPRGEGFDFE